MQDPAVSFLKLWPEWDGRSPEHGHWPPMICKKHEVINTAGNAGVLSPAEEEQAQEQSEGTNEHVPLGEPDAGAFGDSCNDLVSRTFKPGLEKAALFNHVYCKHQKALHLVICKTSLNNNESMYCLHDSCCMRSKALCFHVENVIVKHRCNCSGPLMNGQHVLDVKQQRHLHCCHAGTAEAPSQCHSVTISLLAGRG